MSHQHIDDYLDTPPKKEESDCCLIIVLFFALVAAYFFVKYLIYGWDWPTNYFPYPNMDF